MSGSSRLPPQFGASIDPSAADPEEPFRRAKIADENSLDLITIMDHPYNRRLFDTWTLLTAIGIRTERVRLGTNVLSLPLRPPAMLAKQAATLDVLTGGRVEIGLGAGAYWDGIAAYGGPRRTPGEAYTAFKDALHILRGLWDSDGRSVTYLGEIYQVDRARPGPRPAHRIPIWVGAYGPRMHNLLGMMADGLLVSYNYQTPENLHIFNQRIDAGAEEAGRDPGQIRRGYNLMGVIDVGREDTTLANPKDGTLYGTIDEWVERITDWYRSYRQDTFIFWPAEGNKEVQVEAFAKEVVPAVKRELGY
ncbi:MAG: LLM class flavin-dependent oxidoreductase [Anaerolineales bacterium]|nr:LLM class flavin-dependent oxidoreductase [Anaerolineales bacterium]